MMREVHKIISNKFDRPKISTANHIIHLRVNMMTQRLDRSVIVNNKCFIMNLFQQDLKRNDLKQILCRVFLTRNLIFPVMQINFLAFQAPSSIDLNLVVVFVYFTQKGRFCYSSCFDDTPTTLQTVGPTMHISVSSRISEF